MNNFTHQLYILTEHDELYRRAIETLNLPDLTITTNRDAATLLLAAPPMAAPYLNDFPRLTWLQSAYAGVDALMAPGLRQDYELTNVKGIFGQQIAEYVLGYAISHYRHFACYQQQQTQQRWQPHLYQSLSGKTMTILGTGSIGSHLAKVASAFGLEVIGVNRSGIPPKQSQFTTTYHVNELGAALAKADIIVNTLPNTPDTIGLLGAETFAHCHQALLFNVGRGKTLVEDDLIPALDAGQLAHAFLDVFVSEPLTADHPFWRHTAITVTPHIAALSFPEQVVEIFAANYALWRDGFRLQHRIDFSKGY